MIGNVKSGYIGNFPSFDTLPLPEKNAGNTATTGNAEAIEHFFSTGKAWNAALGASKNGVINVMDLLTEEEKAQVRDPEGQPTIVILPKIQAALNARYLEYGSEAKRRGGQGVCMVFEAGSYLFDGGENGYGLELRAGMQLMGVSAKGETRFIQTDDTKAPVATVLGRANNTDDTQRRTEVRLSNIQFMSNGNLDDLGEKIHCVQLIADPGEDGDDSDEGLVNRTGTIVWDCSFTGASGTGFYSFKRGKNWMHQSSATNNGENGIFVQGPDSLFHKCFCGNNGKEQIWCKESATPMFYDLELGPGLFPGQFPAILLSNCPTVCLLGGNINGWVEFQGDEDVVTAGAYGRYMNNMISHITFIFKEKTFIDDDDVLNELDGYIVAKDIRGLHVQNCQFTPDTVTEDDPGNPGQTWTRYLYRPKSIIHISGNRSAVVFDCKLPPLDNPLWPAGDPTTWSGSMPTNTYDSISNKMDQILIKTSDTGEDTTTKGWVFDNIKFLPGSGMLGITDGSGVATGTLGEFKNVDIDSGAAVSLTTATVASLGSLSLTAGNWELRGKVILVGAGATPTTVEASISSNAASIDNGKAKRYTAATLTHTAVTGPLTTLNIGPVEVSVTATESRYLTTRASFSAGTVSAYGVLQARRIT